MTTQRMVVTSKFPYLASDNHAISVVTLTHTHTHTHTPTPTSPHTHIPTSPHTHTQMDKDGDGLTSLDEFLTYSKGEGFKDDEAWKSVVEEDNFDEEEMDKYEVRHYREGLAQGRHVFCMYFVSCSTCS